MSGAGRVVMSTHSRAEAEMLLQRPFPGIVLAPDRDGSSFTMRYAASGDDRLRSTEVMVSGQASARSTMPEDVVAAGFVLSGKLSVAYARSRLDTTRPFLRPGGTALLRMQDPHLRLITFDGERFRVAAARYAESSGQRLRLTRTTPVSAQAASAWRWIADRIHDAVRDDEAFANPIVATEMFDLGVRVLLAAFGEPAGRAGHAAELSASPAPVRRAVAFLEERAGGPVTIPEVAEAARVSIRSLQSQFQRHLGVSPLEHLRHIRLEAARAELLSTAGFSSVQEVAERWGFGNSGRFAKQYFERFNERPSDTLRRHA